MDRPVSTEPQPVTYSPRTARFLSMHQASVYLGGTPSAETLYRLARDGHLPVKRIGRRLVISEMRLEEWANTPGDARSHVYAGTELAARS